MNDARAAILGRIREALHDVPKSERAHDVPVDRSYRTVDSASFAERISLFVERVREYKAVFERSGPRNCHRPSPTPVRRGA